MKNRIDRILGEPVGIAIVAVLAAAVAPTAPAAVLRVGAATDAACTHTELQAALDAAAANQEADEIRISTGMYDRGGWSIDGHAHALAIVGGYADCGAEIADAPPTELVGSRLPSPVLAIAASADVRLANLDIAGGTGLQQPWLAGGIASRSSGKLALEGVYVHDNIGAFGGGIGVAPDSGEALLTADERVEISGNFSSQNGAGVSAARTRVAFDRVLVARNETTGCGGGLHLSGRVGSGVSVVSGTIERNEAARGAAFCATEGALLRVESRAGQRPTRIGINQASMAGGAFAVDAGTVATTPTGVLLVDAWVDRNGARHGGAVDIDAQGAAAGGGARFCAEANGLASLACADLVREADEAAACTDQHPVCGAFGGNYAVSGTVAGNGSLVRMRGAAATLDLSGFRADLQRGASFVHARGGVPGTTAIRLASGLVAGNLGNGDGLFDLEGVSGAILGGVTIADNEIGAPHVLRSTQALVLRDSIVWQPGTVVRAGAATPADTLSQLIVHDLTGLGAGESVVMEDPRFIRQPATQAYWLAPGSPAIDYGRTSIGAHVGRSRAGIALDADGEPRDFDEPEHAERHGTRDLGAYEMIATRGVFADGFER